MEKDKLITRLVELGRLSDSWMAGTYPQVSPADAHPEADELLLDYIADSDISAAYKTIVAWHE